MGAFNVVLLPVFFLILHYSGLEPFTIPEPLVLLSLFLNGFFGTFISDLIWSLVVVLASGPPLPHLLPSPPRSALLATMGLSLTIPLAIGVDALRGRHPTKVGQYFGGSSIVVLAFLLVNLTSKAKERRLFRRLKAKCCSCFCVKGAV